MTTPKKPNEKLSDKFIFTTKESSRTILMSFGLLNTLVSFVRTPVDVLNLGANPDLAMAVVSEVLAERNEEGVVTRYPSPFAIDRETSIAVLNWAGSHILDFFTKTLSQTSKDLRVLTEVTPTTPTHGQHG